MSEKGVTINVSLYDFDSDEIREYAKNYLGLISESDIADFDDDDLLTELEHRGWDITGWYRSSIEVELDYKDQEILREIIGKFNNASWQEREDIWKKLMT